MAKRKKVTLVLSSPPGPPLPKKRKARPPIKKKVAQSEEPNPLVENSPPPPKKRGKITPLSKPGQSDFADYLWGRKSQGHKRSQGKKKNVPGLTQLGGE